jgi:hypothetical protein
MGIFLNGYVCGCMNVCMYAHTHTLNFFFKGSVKALLRLC